tara:strand:+ start:909 stop:1460 length:552 start_codon:yes stop_codon:yes gene_type:complete
MFNKYLTEAKKVYEFSIGVAGELPEGFEDTMETALQKFSVNSLGAGKKTPIQEKPLDFPQLQNCEVTYWETGLNYPSTPEVLSEYLAMCCNLDRSSVIVRTKHDPRIEYQEIDDETPYVSALETEDMGGESAQNSVGTNRVMELLKELESTRAGRADPIQDVKPGEGKDITDKENTVSPVGSK